MKVPAICVSDHALVRYLERCKGLDLVKVRDEMREQVRAAVVLGSKRSSSKGVTFILNGAEIVTVLPGSSPVQSRIQAAAHRGNGLKRVQRPEGRR